MVKHIPGLQNTQIIGLWNVQQLQEQNICRAHRKHDAVFIFFQLPPLPRHPPKLGHLKWAILWVDLTKTVMVEFTTKSGLGGVKIAKTDRVEIHWHGLKKSPGGCVVNNRKLNNSATW